MKKLVFLALLLGNAFAADNVLINNYGQQVIGCIQQTVQTTGHNRVQLPAAYQNKWVWLYCEAAADFATGDACRYVVGGSTVDVTGLTTPTRVGETIFSGQQTSVFITPANSYISAISKTASSKLNICIKN